jgi:VanZ family protein
VTRLIIWLPPLAWMAAIMWFSSGEFSAENTGSVLGPLLHWLVPSLTATQVDAVHGAIRKGAHMGEFALLAVLWFVAFTRGPRWPPRRAAWTALVICVAWSFLDELHQAMEPTRTPSVLDVGWDTAGALLASVVARMGWRRASRRLTTALLWLAAVGGAGLIAIDRATGVPSGWLWATVPAAVALLALRRWLGASRATPPATRRA